MEQAIIDFVRGSDMPLTIGDITESTGAKKSDALRCLREQTVIGNIAYEPIQGGPGGQYIWIGSTRRPPMEGLNMDAVGRKPLEPTADELADLPEELLTELELPNSVITQPENVTIERKDMTNAENTTTTAQPLTPKVRYLIQAAKDKMATANSEKSAKQIAKRFVNEGHKRVEISTIYPFAVAKQGIEVERVWQ